MEQLTGIGVSPGVAVGPALVAIQRTQVIRFPIRPDRIARELSALERARERSREQLEQIREHVAATAGSDLAKIFDAQLLMLEDPAFIGRAASIVYEERVNAEWAVQRTLDDVESMFDEVEDPYLHERKGDLHDVAGRVRLNLRDEKTGPRERILDFDGPCVLIADELTPSVVAQLDWTRIRAFAIDAGSRTYHTAILARSLGVPAVVGLHDVSRRVPPGASVIVDGESGRVIIDPSPSVRLQAERRAMQARADVPSAEEDKGPVRTSDGLVIALHANIERPEDVAAALRAGAEGVGLYRSEFLLAGGAPDRATEDQQYEVYRQLVEGMAGFPVTVRTFDVDERQQARPRVDVALDAWLSREARGGHAGLRGIRFSLAQPDTFKRQLRALLRAAAHGPLRIMFPFVSSAGEVREARRVLGEARQELRVRGVEAPAVPVGVMIEVPSAAFTARLLAREADFFTIGTNDLIQYTLAVDRTDDRVSNRYEPLHPAVLRLLREVRRAASRARIPVSLCGEMASDPLLLRLLVGFGLCEFSMTPGAIPMARRVLRSTSARDMAKIAAKAMTLATTDEIEQCLSEAAELLI